MPQADSTVGALLLPLAPGAQDTAVPDPLVDGMLAYLAHWLNADLSAKLTSLRGASPVAVPTGNLYPWDPTTRPSALFARGKGDGGASPLPGLFCWRAGSKRANYSTLMSCREVQLKVAWISELAVLPASWEDRAGILPAAEAVIVRAVDIGYHPAYQGGASIGVLLGLCRWGVIFASAQSFVFAPTPAAGADQPTVRGYPALVATLTAWEGIGQPTPTAAEAEPRDMMVEATIVGELGEVQDGVTVMTRVVPAPPEEGDT